MYPKFYILSFDRQDKVNYTTFHDKLIALPEVITWSHYINSSYILVSDHSAHDLTLRIQELFPVNKQFFVGELNIKNNNFNGWLPEQAWDWLFKSYKNIKGYNY